MNNLNELGNKLNKIKDKKSENKSSDKEIELKENVSYLMENDIKISTNTTYKAETYFLIEKFKSNYPDETNESLVLKGIEAILNEDSLTMEQLKPISNKRLEKFFNRSQKMKESYLKKKNKQLKQ